DFVKYKNFPSPSTCSLAPALSNVKNDLLPPRIADTITDHRFVVVHGGPVQRSHVQAIFHFENILIFFVVVERLLFDEVVVQNFHYNQTALRTSVM
uniref:Uncharacterized protein n=1 Tax=Romanomermis culicivorax TaxID=13658 RepID=A0A915JC25_ROMCU